MIVHVLVLTRAGNVLLERSAGGSQQIAEVRGRVSMPISLSEAVEGTKGYTFLGEREAVHEAVGDAVAVVAGEPGDTRAAELAEALDMVITQIKAATGRRSPTEAQVRASTGQAAVLLDEAMPLNEPEVPGGDATRRLAKLKS
jgi:hypothetical protein